MNMEEDFIKHELLSEERLGVIIKNPPDLMINYITSDGKQFSNRAEAVRHDRVVARKHYYEHLLKNRNWLMRFFNIKPSMKFYDQQMIMLDDV
jgi:hypothetical protein